MIALKCKASGCPEAHPQHYCNICENDDSDHHVKDCPQAQRGKNGCKLKGYEENHTKHSCNTCEDEDSNHSSQDLPQAKGKQIGCKAQGCTKSHSHHYCRLCDNRDSNHLALNCPNGVELYHGTCISNISSIAKIGLSASKSGRIGPGVYFTTKEEAMKFAKNRNTGTGVAVFKCIVNLGNCYDNGNQDDMAGSWQHNYDSCISIHPPWAGNPNFSEWCLKDPRKLKISALYLLDGEYEGDLDFPNVFVSRSCKVKGKITAKNLVTDEVFCYRPPLYYIEFRKN